MGGVCGGFIGGLQEGFSGRFTGFHRVFCRRFVVVVKIRALCNKCYAQVRGSEFVPCKFGAPSKGVDAGRAGKGWLWVILRLRASGVGFRVLLHCYTLNPNPV